MASTKISRSDMQRYINNRMIEIKDNILNRMEKCKRNSEETEKEVARVNAVIQKHFQKAYRSLPADVKKYIRLNAESGYISNLNIDSWHVQRIKGNFKSPADEKEYSRLQTLLNSLPAKRREIENKLIVSSIDPALVSEIEKILSTLK